MNQDELTYRNARLCATPFFGLALGEWRALNKTPDHLPSPHWTTAWRVESMERHARRAAERFIELSNAEAWIADDDNIDALMLAQEYDNLRCVFEWLPTEMTEAYFSDFEVGFWETLCKNHS